MSRPVDCDRRFDVDVRRAIADFVFANYAICRAATRRAAEDEEACCQRFSKGKISVGRGVVKKERASQKGNDPFGHSDVGM